MPDQTVKKTNVCQQVNYQAPSSYKMLQTK